MLNNVNILSWYNFWPYRKKGNVQKALQAHKKGNWAFTRYQILLNSINVPYLTSNSPDIIILMYIYIEIDLYL